MRWLFRYLQESDTLTLDDAAFAVGLLQALDGARHDEALLALQGMAEEATAPTSMRRIPAADVGVVDEVAKLSIPGVYIQVLSGTGRLRRL